MLRLIKAFLMKCNIFAIDPNDPDFVRAANEDVKEFKKVYAQEMFYGDVATKMNCVQQTLLSQFSNRFRGMNINILWTSVLDLRFRSLKHLTYSKRTNLVDLFVEEVLLLAKTKAEEQLLDTSSALEYHENTSNKKEDMFSFSSMYDSPSKTRIDAGDASVEVDLNTLKCRVGREIDTYLDSSLFVPPSCDPLVWWKENKSRYPYIAPIARKWLCVPATSTPSERVFSDCGLAGTAKRSRLIPWALQNQVILRRNIDAVGLNVESAMKVINSK